MVKHLIGDRAFYRRLFSLMIPIMIQNGITNLVNMLDNIMIGAVGTAQMTGVAVANQLFFVFTLCIFGVVSGAGIYGAQFVGCGDTVNVRNTFRFKLLFSTLITLLGIGVFLTLGETLISAYMKGEQGVTDPVATLNYAKGYMLVMLVGLVPFALTQCYSSTLREAGKPVLPMVAGLVAVLVNLCLNYVLIFGKFGAPKLGVNGAAVATVTSRFVELAIVAVYSHRRTEQFPFFKAVFRGFGIPLTLVKKLLLKALPLMANETMWAAGIAVINQCYSLRSLDAMAACNISQTFWNVFSIAFLAVGNAIAIILGQMLGAGELKEAKAASYKLVTFSFGISVLVGSVYLLAARFIPYIYNTEQEIRDLATLLMSITAIIMPFDALAHASYFSLRSGGKMFVTILFDSVFTWCVNVLLAFILSRFTTISFPWMFVVIQSITILKGFLGILLLRSDFWVKNITEETK